MEKKQKQILVAAFSVAAVLLAGKTIYNSTKENHGMADVMVMSENIFSFCGESAYGKICAVDFEEQLGKMHEKHAEKSIENKITKSFKEQTPKEDIILEKGQKNSAENKADEISEPNHIASPEAPGEVPERMEGSADGYSEGADGSHSDSQQREGDYELPISVTETNPGEENNTEASGTNPAKEGHTDTSGTNPGRENNTDISEANPSKENNTEAPDENSGIKQNAENGNASHNNDSSNSQGGNHALDGRDNAELPFVPVK